MINVIYFHDLWFPLFLRLKIAPVHVEYSEENYLFEQLSIIKLPSSKTTTEDLISRNRQIKFQISKV